MQTVRRYGATCCISKTIPKSLPVFLEPDQKLPFFSAGTMKKGRTAWEVVQRSRRHRRLPVGRWPPRGSGVSDLVSYDVPFLLNFPP